MVLEEKRNGLRCIVAAGLEFKLNRLAGGQCGEPRPGDSRAGSREAKSTHASTPCNLTTTSSTWHHHLKVAST